MSTGAAVELDFFGMEKGNSSSKSQFQILLEKRRNVRGVQNAITKMNPQFLKSMIGGSGVPTAASVEGKVVLPVNVDGFIKKEVVSPPNNSADLLLLGMENIPVFTPLSRGAASETADPGTLNAPLTIFYNGTVCVFDLPRDKAEMIMKLAEEGKSKIVGSASPEPKLTASSTTKTNKQELIEKLNEDLPKLAAPSSNQQELLQKLNGGDLPIARKKSLQRFLAKRKERLTTISPYGNGGSEYVVEKKLLLQE